MTRFFPCWDYRVCFCRILAAQGTLASDVREPKGSSSMDRETLSKHGIRNASVANCLCRLPTLLKMTVDQIEASSRPKAEPQRTELAGLEPTFEV